MDVLPSYESSQLEVELEKDAGKQLNAEQLDILERITAGSNVGITGSAGTGKSFVIKHICSVLENNGKVYRIVAPTGVAAVNVGGQTIHRFLGIRPEVKTLPDYIKLCMKRTKVPWTTLNVILIDEISMIHPKLFLLFDSIAKLHRKSTLPFGGIQMILIGDFYQLCPIRQKDDVAGSADYIFETDLWKELDLHITVLKRVMRQNEKHFIEALNDLRHGLFSPRVIALVQQCALNKKQPGKHYVKLHALNAQKDNANETRLMKLTTKERIYRAVDIGNEIYLKDCRAAKIITLRIGCPVMLLWNMPQYDLCNGSIGILEDYDELGLPVVKFNNGQKVSIVQQTWTIQEKNRFGIHILASRKQIPLAVAYAISVHKSQGLTLDHSIVDCAGIFTTGQLYVALSRAATVDGLIIKNFDPDAIMVDQKVIDFYDTLR